METQPYHVIIAGGRDFNNHQLLKERCNHLLSQREKVIVVSGAARGADRIGEEYALEQGHGLLRMPADWEVHGNSAGYLRNVAMAERAQALIAFWDGKSKGTAHMIETARKHGLQVRVVFYKT